MFPNLCYTRGDFMGRGRLKKKKRKKLEFKRCQVFTDEVLSGFDASSEDIVRLKVTMRKGARIESVPLKKLERLAGRSRRLWEFKDGWLMLYGIFNKSGVD